MVKKLAAGMAMMVLIGNAYADIATCPHKATIKQVALSDGGFSYSAPGPNQQSWTGENEYAEENYLAAIDFKNAAFNDRSKAVICSYEASEGQAAVRLSLKPFNHLKAAAGTRWDKQECNASDISQCSFEYTP